MSWEYELQGISVAEELEPAPQLMRGWTKQVIDEMSKISIQIDDFLAGDPGPDAILEIKVALITPANLDEVSAIIHEALA